LLNVAQLYTKKIALEKACNKKMTLKVTHSKLSASQWHWVILEATFAV